MQLRRLLEFINETLADVLLNCPFDVVRFAYKISTNIVVQLDQFESQVFICLVVFPFNRIVVL